MTEKAQTQEELLMAILQKFGELLDKALRSNIEIPMYFTIAVFSEEEHPNASYVTNGDMVTMSTALKELSEMIRVRSTTPIPH